MTRRCDVAIVGGGIGGLTLAASLLRQSISSEIFGQDAELREIGAGSRLPVMRLVCWSVLVSI